VNLKLCENNQVGMFVTAFLGILNLGTGVMDFVNAGHNPPLLLTPKGIGFLEVKPGFVLGGFPETCYQQGQITLCPGDSLFLYTDGVTEAEDVETREFGNARLLESAQSWERGTRANMQELLGTIMHDLQGFSCGAPQWDDITMLGLAYYGTGEGRCGN
jgi:serine phosphatase RsbU (regulator of sigma subunit)